MTPSSASAIADSSTAPRFASLPATTVPLITIHADGSRTEGVIRVVHPPAHPPTGEPIVHHCAGLTRW
ncbi:hypothetical protein [Streptomyces sp. CA-111067]|uniref:hypothetical protein n=1 Tax=Streptomyces sp. CA-111067 TaxID=3240046 RepID=UPI003D956639